MELSHDNIKKLYLDETERWYWCIWQTRMSFQSISSPVARVKWNKKFHCGIIGGKCRSWLYFSSLSLIVSYCFHCKFPHRSTASSDLWRVGGSQPPDFGLRGSWMSRETLLYLIMDRKYVRKWWLFYRNRIICPEFSCKWQICLDKRKFWNKWLKKVIRNFLTEKNRNFSKICLEKVKFFGSLLGGKIKHFLPGSTAPQISNQIDTTDGKSFIPAISINSKCMTDR